jgi:hypothetical protein
MAMAACPNCDRCTFHDVVTTSVVTRLKFKAFFSYCRGGQHEYCAIHKLIADGKSVPKNLLPDGYYGDYLDDGVSGTGRFLVVEDSPVFAALSASTIKMHFPNASVERCATYDEAVTKLASGGYTAVVCGFGLDGGRTAHDLRMLTTAPLVVLTGRPGDIDAPSGAQVVHKGAGAEALAGALRACVV